MPSRFPSQRLSLRWCLFHLIDFTPSSIHREKSCSENRKFCQQPFGSYLLFWWSHMSYMSNTLDLGPVDFTPMRIESDRDRNRKWVQGVGGTGSKGLTEASGGLKSWQTDSIGSDGDCSSWQESIGLPEVCSRRAEEISQNKRATHVTLVVLLAWIYLVLLSMNRNKHATHEYTSFFNPWTETSTLHMNIPRSLIHEPKQAHYTWIYLVL